MLLERILGAFMFKKGVYAEVERDASFTATAWIIVAVISFLSQLGAYAGFGMENIGKWLIGAIVSTGFAVGGFALAAYLAAMVAKSAFNADVTFDELVRTLGLAYVWRIVGLLGVLGGLSVALACLLAPVQFAAGLLGLVAWLFAVKEAVDLEWPQTIVVIIIGWIIQMLIMLVGGLVLGMFGIATGAAAGLLSGLQ